MIRIDENFSDEDKQDESEVNPLPPPNGDDENFDDFGSQPQSRSLGEVWRNNPMLKIVAVVVGVVVVVSALLFFGGDQEKAPSMVSGAPAASEAPGGQVSESYRSAVEQVNQQRLEEAVKTGESTMPIPVDTPQTDVIKAVDEEPPVAIDDPLAQWRAASQQQSDQAFQPAAPNMGNPDQLGQNVPMRPVAVPPSPETIRALSTAMSNQMQGILARHGPTRQGSLKVTSDEYMKNTVRGKMEEAQLVAQTEGDTTVEETQEILIPAGTIVYAQTLTESNSDAPGPVLALLASGPLMGARSLGTFQKTEEFLTIRFYTVVVNGVSLPINAVALDAKTTLPALATEVDHRYFKRIILPAAAAFIEGMGNAVAQSDTTSVIINGDTVTTETRDIDTEKEFYAGVGEAASEISDAVDEEADRTQTMIRVASGTPMGLLFLEPVIKPKDFEQFRY